MLENEIAEPFPTFYVSAGNAFPNKHDIFVNKYCVLNPFYFFYFLSKSEFIKLANERPIEPAKCRLLPSNQVKSQPLMTINKQKSP